MAKRDPRMIHLGYGKFVRADRVYALVPIEGAERRDGRRTYVHVGGLAEPGGGWRPPLRERHPRRRGDRPRRGGRAAAPPPRGGDGPRKPALLVALELFDLF